MKKLNKSAIITILVTVIQFVITVVVTVVLALCKPMETWQIVLSAVLAFIGILIVLAAEGLAEVKNIFYSIFYRKTESVGDEDKPSVLAVFLVKIFGYFLLGCQLFFLFI